MHKQIVNETSGVLAPLKTMPTRRTKLLKTLNKSIKIFFLFQNKYRLQSNPLPKKRPNSVEIENHDERRLKLNPCSKINGPIDKLPMK